jgi:hypothetical protein
VFTRAADGTDGSDVCDIWNVFHDATIVDVAGAIHQNVDLRLECDYLRERFEGSDGYFVLSLVGCSKFEFESSADPGEVISDFATIGNLRLWVRSANAMNDHLEVRCARHALDATGGALRVAAAGIELRLDTGRLVPIDEINQAATEYWKEFWSSRPIE